MHPLDDLSAYLDGELDPARRATVETHLAACDGCRARLSELRATARLIAALPSAAPARSLVPRVGVPAWLAPLRTLATIASGAALFVFIASSVIAIGPQATGAGAPAAAPPELQRRSVTAASATPAGPVGPAAQPGPVFQPAVGAAGAAASPSPSPDKYLTDRDRAAASTAAPLAPRADNGTTAPTAVAFGAPESAARTAPSPLVWLALAIAFGAFALVLQRRLRRA
jgi:hypothetical protein